MERGGRMDNNLERDLFVRSVCGDACIRLFSTSIDAVKIVSKNPDSFSLQESINRILLYSFPQVMNAMLLGEKAYFVFQSEADGSSLLFVKGKMKRSGNYYCFYQAIEENGFFTASGTPKQKKKSRFLQVPQRFPIEDVFVLLPESNLRKKEYRRILKYLKNHYVGLPGIGDFNSEKFAWEMAAYKKADERQQRKLLKLSYPLGYVSQSQSESGMVNDYFVACQEVTLSLMQWSVFEYFILKLATFLKKRCGDSTLNLTYSLDRKKKLLEAQKALQDRSLSLQEIYRRTL